MSNAEPNQTGNASPSRNAQEVLVTIIKQEPKPPKVIRVRTVSEA